MSPEEMTVRIENIMIEHGMDKLEAYEKSRSFMREYLASNKPEMLIPGTSLILYRKDPSKAETKRLPAVQNPKKNSLFD